MNLRKLFAACGKGLEPALEGEVLALGARDVEVRRGGVAFRGDRRLAYAANLWLRSAIRVQEELLAAEVRDADDVYAAASTLDWANWITADQTLAVSASVRDTEGIRHSGHAALRVKDAVVDHVRARTRRRPSVDTKDPDVRLKLVVQRDRMLLYRDLSGESLHKRGCRPIQVKSPLNEATAAGLLLLSDWDLASPLADPMCGSGTFLVEAAWLATDRAPGLGRRFAFEGWLDHDLDVWNALKAEAADRVKPTLDFPLMGGDHHAGALSLAVLGAEAAGVAHLVSFQVSDARDLVLPERPATVVVNPPYGVRLGPGEDLDDAWESLGNFLHRQCKGATAWVLSGSKTLTRHLGLRTSLRIPVMNGPIECRWLKYEIRA
jgi:putative N6-adenine-specific DNA methylase